MVLASAFPYLFHYTLSVQLFNLFRFLFAFLDFSNAIPLYFRAIGGVLVNVDFLELDLKSVV